METQEKLNEYLKQRERLCKKGCNDEKLNDKIRECQKILRDEAKNL